MDKIITFLYDLDILSGVTIDEIAKIRGFFIIQNYMKDITLFQEGDAGDILYIIFRGSVSSHCNIPNGTKRGIAEFKTGDFFGEMAIFEDAPRSATCITTDKTTVITLSKNAFFKMIKKHSGIAIKIMTNMLRIITQRLRNSNEFLSDLVHWGEKARRRAILDDSTGIYNRRYLDDSLEEQLKRAEEEHLPLSLVMIDIDNFGLVVKDYDIKVINTIISEIVEIFKKFLRDNDIFARYGGDEFSILMPDTEKDIAYECTTRICNAVAEHDFSHIIKKEISKITISMGIASFPVDSVNEVAVLQEKADTALYAAKNEGKNRVIGYKKNNT